MRPTGPFTIECQCCARVVERGGTPVGGVRSARCATRSRTPRNRNAYNSSQFILHPALRAVGCSCLGSPTLECVPVGRPTVTRRTLLRAALPTCPRSCARAPLSLRSMISNAPTGALSLSLSLSCAHVVAPHISIRQNDKEAGRRRRRRKNRRIHTLERPEAAQGAHGYKCAKWMPQRGYK